MKKESVSGVFGDEVFFQKGGKILRRQTDEITWEGRAFLSTSFVDKLSS